MKNMCLKDSLLDDLWHETGCMYLSDLKSSREQEMLCVALRRLLPEKYTFRAWSEAATYLTGRISPIDFDSQQEVRAYLIEQCEAALSCAHQKENEMEALTRPEVSEKSIL